MHHIDTQPVILELKLFLNKKLFSDQRSYSNIIFCNANTQGFIYYLSLSNSVFHPKNKIKNAPMKTSMNSPINTMQQPQRMQVSDHRINFHLGIISRFFNQFISKYSYLHYWERRDLNSREKTAHRTYSIQWRVDSSLCHIKS